MKKVTYLLLILFIIVTASSSVLAFDTQVLNSEDTTYIVSEENQTISRILPRTSIEEFKSNINAESSQIHIFDNAEEKEITQGYIGTGMKIKIDGNSTTYTASVIGDLTGDGEIKQIEVSKTIKHVVGLEKHQLSGVNAMSADVDANGEVEQKDVSILIKYVVFGKLEIGEISKSTKPNLTVTGEKINEESIWYTSDVQVKMEVAKQISGHETSYIQYELTNTITNDKKEGKIKNGESLTIVEEGVYEITAHSVDKYNNKSETAKVVINLDTTDPVAGSMHLYKNNKEGEIYLNNTWTNQNIYAEMQDGSDTLSGHSNTIYKLMGAEQNVNIKEPITIAQEGIYKIIVITTDVAGRSSQRIYTIRIDKQKPEKPTLEVVDGEKQDQDNEWYRSNVIMKVIQGSVDNGGSGIKYTTYEIEGPAQQPETDIKDDGRILLTESGEYTIKAYNYDTAGNKSDPEIKYIKVDQVEPQDIQVEADEITGTSYKIKASATEEDSGIALYQIYVDGKLEKEIQTNQNNIECLIENQTSKTHQVEVRVTDIAGNTGTQSTTVEMARLEMSDIDYVEFVIENFTRTKDEEEVSKGAEYIISDTSISDATKYIQVSSSESNVMGKVIGSTRLVRKDGNVVDEFQYYPTEMLLEIAQYSNGSGSRWEHQASVNMANTILTNEDIEEGTTENGSVDIATKQNADNMFEITDIKQIGTKTYTRLIIRQVTWNGEKIPFKITSTIL